MTNDFEVENNRKTGVAVGQRKRLTAIFMQFSIWLDEL